MSKMIEAARRFSILSRPVRREIPLPRKCKNGASFYPLVGAVIGFIVGGLGLGLSYVAFPSCRHPAGCMGGADRRPSSRWLDGQRGCASHRSRERMLEIMKDSRVGAMGVMACIALLLKASLIMSVWDLSAGAWKQEAWSLVLAPVWSRWFMVHAMYRWPMAREVRGLPLYFTD